MINVKRIEERASALILVDRVVTESSGPTFSGPTFHRPLNESESVMDEVLGVISEAEAAKETDSTKALSPLEKKLDIKQAEDGQSNFSEEPTLGEDGIPVKIEEANAGNSIPDPDYPEKVLGDVEYAGDTKQKEEKIIPNKDENAIKEDEVKGKSEESITSDSLLTEGTAPFCCKACEDGAEVCPTTPTTPAELEEASFNPYSLINKIL